jgi:ABC-type Fe3+ transport system permease subunit
MVVTRGVEAILDTTFLSALATPFAALLGMVIAWLVVRKNFSEKSWTSPQTLAEQCPARSWDRFILLE